MKKRILAAGIIIILLCLMTRLLWLANVSYPFMMDDNWYATNLVTGEPLSGISDILESQYWHFHTWGGRNITHGILQLTLMAGESAADFLNTLAVICLAFLITCLSGSGRQITHQGTLFLLAYALPISLNPNVAMSMLWQSGAANYLYSSIWILCFLFPYFSALSIPNSPPLILFWMPPLAFIAGWSNENMGPTCFLLACICTFLYAHSKDDHKARPWMIEGIVCSLIGSMLCILAPGNFLRANSIEKSSFSETLFNRLLAMLSAFGNYLFPTFLLLALCFFLKYKLCQKKPNTIQILLTIGSFLSSVAMILSPHYPDRATFGTMILAICCIISLLSDILTELPKTTPFLFVLSTSTSVFAMILLSQEVHR